MNERISHWTTINGRLSQFFGTIFADVHTCAETEPKYRFRVIFVHVLVLVLICIVCCKNNREVLYSTYDGMFHRTNVETQQHWMSRVPWFCHSPLHGLGNTFTHIHTRFSPAFSLTTSLCKGTAKPSVFYSIMAVNGFILLLATCWCFRLSFGLALATAWTFVFVSVPLVPPFFSMISFCGPQYVELIAFGALIIGLFYRIGQHDTIVSVVYCVFFSLLVQWSFLYSPTTVLLQVPVLGIYFVGCFIVAKNKKEFIFKFLTLAATFVVSLFTTLPFVAGMILYSVPIFFFDLQHDRTNLTYVSMLFTGRYNALCPIFVLTSAAGSAMACRYGPPSVRILGFCTCFCVSAIVGLGSFVIFFMPNYSGPSPIYVEYYLWPFYCLFFSFFVFLACKALKHSMARARFRNIEAKLIVDYVRQYRLLILLLPLLATLWSLRGLEFKHTGIQGFYPPKETCITRKLRDEVGIRHGSVYRGMVATFTACGTEERGSSWLADQFPMDHKICFASGNDHRSMGLWHHDIPTLFELHTLITPPYYMMLSRMLARPEDRQLRSVIVLTKPNVKYLCSLGVRYLITDFKLDASAASCRESLRIDEKSTTIFLWELKNPNLASYFPTEITVIESAAKSLAALQKDDFDFTTQAVVDRPLAAANLVKADAVRLAFHKNRMVVEAKSRGSSLVLLPLQYSHCLEMTTSCDPANSCTQLVRLNLMQAGLLFSGTVRAEIQFAYGPFRNQFGRLLDYQDMKKMQLH